MTFLMGAGRLDLREWHIARTGQTPEQWSANMASTKTKTPVAAEEPRQEPVAAPATTADQPEAHEPRQTAPQAPRGQGSTDSQAAVARMRQYLQTAVADRSNPHAVPLAIGYIEGINTVRLHPSASAYKAECLDYLRGKLPKA